MHQLPPDGAKSNSADRPPRRRIRRSCAAHRASTSGAHRLSVTAAGALSVQHIERDFGTRVRHGTPGVELAPLRAGWTVPSCMLAENTAWICRALDRVSRCFWPSRNRVEIRSPCQGA